MKSLPVIFALDSTNERHHVEAMSFGDEGTCAYGEPDAN